MKAFKVMMNRPALGTVTLVDMLPTQEEAGLLAAEVTELMRQHSIEVHCFVAEYEESRYWDNDNRPTQRT